MRILLAEDDRQLRTSMARGLREADHTADQAGTGPEALSLALANAYDAVILDVRLPGMDGLAVCRAVRDAGNTVPILMLTALGGVEQRIAGLDAGADDYMAKTFDFGELLARLRELTRRLRPHAEPAAQSLAVGDLTIDLARHAVRRGEREIPLTAKEFALLTYLARNAGRVVSRAELMQHVWDDARGTYSNIIDVYASRLRRKLDHGEPVELFATVRGVGFMLAAPAPAPERGAAPRRAHRSR